MRRPTVCRSSSLAVASVAALLASGCLAPHARPWKGVDEVIAVLEPTEGNEATGVVRFREADGGVRVTGEVRGLEPGSTHAIHVHQYGDARAADGTSAGGHYNPDEHPHGLPMGQAPRHAGDLGNITADEEGVANVEVTVHNISLAGLRNPVVGRSVIVHAGRDTGEQPTGAAGSRIAQGVIGVANPGG